MYLTPTWFRGVAKALVGSIIARMPRRDICWTQTYFGGLKPSYVSLLLADRPPQERHGLPRIAGVAQAPDRPPLQDRTRCPPSRPDPSRGVLRRAIRISTPVPAPKLLCLHSILSFIRAASWTRPRFHNCFAGGRIPIPHGVLSSHVAGNSGRRISAPPRTVTHALSTPHGQVGRKGRRAPVFPGSWASRQQVSEGHRTLVQVAGRAHRCR